MTLIFKVGTHSIYKYTVLRKRKPPVVGEVIEIVDRTVHGSRPFRVRVCEIKSIDPTNVYFVEMW